MRIRGGWAAAVLLCAGSFASPAGAGIAPYARVEYGSHQLKMSEGNDRIEQTEASLRDSGFPASFQKIGVGYGPSASVGLWLFPAFRVGATYSQEKAVRQNHVHVPGQLFFAHDVDLRMTEIGGEAAVRIRRLAGFTFGGSVATGKAEMIEGLTIQDAGGDYFQDATAEKTMTTYGAFAGFDQTNEFGIAGFVRAGYEFRDVGTMPSQLSISDGFSTTRATSTTIPLDYSGWYVRLGVGYDFGR